MTSPAPVKPITGKTVLYGMIAFFGVIIAVNSVFMYLALDTWPELVSKQSYQDGLKYNETLDAAEVQKLRGWSSTLTFDGNTFRVFMIDKTEAPLEGLTVIATVRRPVNDAANISLIMNEESDTSGYYSSDVSLPLDGRWYIVIEVMQNDAVSYQMEHEVMVEP
ncbi:MAG: FixH family protein [Rhodospirillales bacterium]|jgi:nitrogen fixation protein FixH|nr:FixH family protein [Rhodospirillales bacterium]